MSKQQDLLLDEELTERQDLRQQSDEEHKDQTFDSGTSNPRGRPKLPTLWSRVLHITEATTAANVEHEIFIDQ